MPGSRPLLIPWLVEQINSGRYPGVNWTNQQKTEFCVPWKHGLRQDSSSDDVLLFKAWAMISGVYVESEMPADSSVWKRNFRSALRAKGFLMIMDNKNDAAYPHKVFQLPDGEQQRSKEPTRRRVNRVKDGVDSSPGLPQTSPPVAVEHMILPEEMTVEALLLGPNWFSPPLDQVPLFQVLEELNIHEPQQGQEQYLAMGAAGGNSDLHWCEDFKETMSRTMADNSLSTSFRVSVYYRGRKVLEQMVENSTCFRVVFRPEQISDPSLYSVSLPSPDQVNMLDKTQAQLTQRILEKLGDGLEIFVSGSCIYGLRRGDSRVYWSPCKFEKINTPREVSKQIPEPLYSLKEFIAGLMEFMKNESPSPSFSLFFCLGEKWPDPEKPWEKKLIMVEVVITSLETLKMIAVDGGASSLRSVELQLSDTPSFLDTLEEIMEMC